MNIKTRRLLIGLLYDTCVSSKFQSVINSIRLGEDLIMFWVSYGLLLREEDMYLQEKSYRQNNKQSGMFNQLK